MSAVLKDEHIHTYERSATKHKDWKKQVYRCIDKTCRHYAPAQYIIGKLVLCHDCGKETTVEKEQVQRLRRRTIVGNCCSNSNRAKSFRNSVDQIQKSGILDEMFDKTNENLLPQKDVLSEYLEKESV